MRRIERWNPTLGALTEVLAECAAKEALAVDNRRAQGETLPEVAGIPIIVKDIIDTTPAVCSAGLPFLAGYRPARDALVVRRLRRSGAVILGVSATDPGAFGVRTAAVTHPQAPDHTVGGSSGGSAAAVAAGFCAAALGTDTGGSVRIPSACCLTAGFMPSFGRVPTTGVRPLVWSSDHVGVIARRVADIVPLQRVLDARFASAGHLWGRARVRIGYDPDYFRDAAPEISSGVSDALDAARKLGAEVAKVSLPNPDEATSIHTVIFCSEAAAYHLTAFPGRLDEYPLPARELLTLGKSHYHGYEYVQAVRQREVLRKQVAAALTGVDFVIAPTIPIVSPRRSAPTVKISGTDRDFTWAMVRYTCLFNHTGNPVLSLPSKVISPGLGASVQLIGNVGADRDVLSFGQRLEGALGLDVDRTIRAMPLPSDERPARRT